MIALPVELPHDAIASFCARNHIRRLSLFGSVLTSRFGDLSDIDMLVEFEPERVPGLLDIAGMEIELSAMLGRKADLAHARGAERVLPERSSGCRDPAV